MGEATANGHRGPSQVESDSGELESCLLHLWIYDCCGCLAQVKRLKWLETVRCVQAGTLHRTGRSSVQRYATSGCHLRSTGNAGAGVFSAWDMVKHERHVGTFVFTGCLSAVSQKQLCEVPATTIGEAVYLPPITAPAEVRALPTCRERVPSFQSSSLLGA